MNLSIIQEAKRTGVMSEDFKKWNINGKGKIEGNVIN